MYDYHSSDNMIVNECKGCGGAGCTGTLRPGSRPIASFQGATFYCRNIISEHHKALKQIAKNCLMFA